MRTGRSAAALSALALLAGLASSSGADSVTMTTHYPSPTGVYKKMTTTGATTLARDGGNVGIGTTQPQAQLDMTGLFRPGRFAEDPPGVEGAIYYNTATKRFRAFQGNRWTNLGSGDPDYDSGWVSASANRYSPYYWIGTPGPVLTVNHGLGSPPQRVQILFSPSNPPASVYEFSTSNQQNIYGLNWYSYSAQNYSTSINWDSKSVNIYSNPYLFCGAGSSSLPWPYNMWGSYYGGYYTGSLYNCWAQGYIRVLAWLDNPNAPGTPGGRYNPLDYYNYWDYYYYYYSIGF